MNPKRNFVVEYKSNRRPLKTQSNSIWGNTDLKALAEEIESETSSTSGAPLAVETRSVGSSEIPMGPAVSVPIVEEIDPADSDDKAEPPDEVIAEAARASEPPVLPTTGSTQESKPRRAQRKAVRRPKGTAAAEFIAPIAETARPDIVTEDDLAELDAENKWLKAMLAEKLRAENARLMKMLRRFGVA
ncbi:MULTISPECIES: hypothetical protein [Rhizobium]|uniref:Uncharacterized protein n=1 Tax=Rhizobium paranaense TaxID=1650438 RepID=A0A7W8XYB0_9HYPH|nr:hypothetical protein [Rhizobium paranaense]MBB5577811.1 hypothetical protein [Rhizobium paranaense]